MARFFEFKLPDLGEGVAEGEIVAWHVKEGERVAEDQTMVEVMTDKATVTIGAPRAGKVDKLMAAVGSIVKVGDVLIVIQTGNGSRTASGLPAATAVGDIRDSLPGTNYFGEKRAVAESAGGAVATAAAGETQAVSAAAPTAAVTVRPTSTNGEGHNGESHYDERPLATPATRKLARDLRVDLQRVPGSGPHGRVTHEDVMAYSSSGGVESPEAHAAVGPAARTTRDAVRPQPRADEPRSQARTQQAPNAPSAGQRVPFVGLRRRIAEKMSVSKNTAAHFTFVEECEVDALIEMRSRLRADAKARGVELTYLAFAIKAVVAALKRHPMLNSSLDTQSNELVLHDGYHIGIAAATDQGLVVPVIHDADKRSLLDVAAEVERLGQAARSGSLTREELSGSTFTITSLGKQAGLFAVPIINFPNVGILGLHRMKERAVVRNGQVAVGHIMLLSLSLDHRIVDGHVGAAFAYDVIHYLEDPARLLLEG